MYIQICSEVAYYLTFYTRNEMHNKPRSAIIIMVISSPEYHEKTKVKNECSKQNRRNYFIFQQGAGLLGSPL